MIYKTLVNYLWNISENKSQLLLGKFFLVDVFHMTVIPVVTFPLAMFSLLLSINWISMGYRIF